MGILSEILGITSKIHRKLGPKINILKIEIKEIGRYLAKVKNYFNFSFIEYLLE